MAKEKDSAVETPDAARSRLRRWQISLLVALYIVYCGVLINRRGISVTAPTMTNDTSINYTKADLGLLLAVGNGAHLFSELISGAVTDRIGGRFVFMVASFGPAVASLMFSFGRSMPIWAMCWALNRIFQAAVYPAMTKLISAWFPPTEYGRAVGILSSSSRVGAMLAALGMGTLILQLDLVWNQA
jgi:OPA family glycerol-3-phosphate transporter-like MFS transporter